MITALHYFDASFINIKNKITSSSKSMNKSNTDYKNNFSYFLDRAINPRVKSYALNLSSSFNKLKHISHTISGHTTYNLSTDKIIENTDKFISAYNDFISFLDFNNKNNSSLITILDSIKDLIYNSKELLTKLNIDVSSSGTLTLNDSISPELANIDLNSFKSFHKKVYNTLCDFMQNPLTNYMDFKDFSYYFNYSVNWVNNPSFKIIEQGILFDLSL